MNAKPLLIKLLPFFLLSNDRNNLLHTTFIFLRRLIKIVKNRFTTKYKTYVIKSPDAYSYEYDEKFTRQRSNSIICEKGLNG